MLFRRLLRFPLEMKLLIPNAVVLGFALAGFGGVTATGIVVIAAAVNFILVRIALRPVKEMQLVAEDVAKGNLSARMRSSPIADAGLNTLACTFNLALHQLTEAREEVRACGARIVYAQERERVSVSRELHESIGQTLAAASYQAAAAAQASAGQSGQSNTLEVARLLRTAIEDLLIVSRQLHPRVADDLGLPAALEALARSTMDRSLVDVQLSVRGFEDAIPSLQSSTLYRIAEQSLRNIELRANGGGTVTMALRSDMTSVTLEINDDCVFDGSDGQAVHASLSSAAERLSLLGGEMLIESNFLGGSKVVARLTRYMEAA